MQGLLAQEGALSVLAGLAGLCLGALAVLLGHWTASPALGAGIALAAAALGAALSRLGAPPEEGDAGAWALGGCLLALAIPAALRFAGLAMPSPARLAAPFAPEADVALSLLQAAGLAAGAACCLARALRACAPRAAPLAAAALGVPAAAALASRASPETVLAAGAAAALLLAAALEAPWRRWESAPMRARAAVIALASGLLLGTRAPGLLPDVWTARLDAAYPGGRFLRLERGLLRSWGAYRFSSGDAVLLRDGAVQPYDPASAKLALRLIMGQLSGARTALIVHPPSPLAVSSAAAEGWSIRVEDESAASAAALDAMGSADWRPPSAPGACDGALMFASVPLDSARTARRFFRLAGEVRDGGAAGLLLPKGARPSVLAELASKAEARRPALNVAVIDLPRGTLFLAAGGALEKDAETLFGRLPDAARAADPWGARALNEGLSWRPSPSRN